MVTNEKERMELEMAVLVRALLGKWKQIALSALLGGVLLLLVTVLFVKPEYQSDVVFRVTNRAGGSEVITPEDVSASRDLVESCAVVVETRAFLKEMASLAGVDRTGKELGKMVEAAAVKETEFLRVTVTSKSPEEAVRLAETIGTLLPERVSGILEGAGAALVDEAVFSTEACAPGYVSNTAIGILLGLLLSCAGVVAMEIRKKYRQAHEAIS